MVDDKSGKQRLTDATRQKMADEAAVRDMLKPHPWESLAGAAARIENTPSLGGVLREVALIILRDGDPWDRIAEAATLARTESA